MINKIIAIFKGTSRNAKNTTDGSLFEDEKSFTAQNELSLNADSISDWAKSATYEELFEVAKTFTKGKSYSLDSPTKSSSCETSVSTLLKELSDLLGKYQSNYNHPDYTPVYLFGGDCANIHINVLEYIQEYHCDISANITIGGVLSHQFGYRELLYGKPVF